VARRGGERPPPGVSQRTPSSVGCNRNAETSILTMKEERGAGSVIRGEAFVVQQKALIAKE